MTDTTTEPQRETVASSYSQRAVSRSRCRGQFPNNIVVRKLIAGRSRLGPFLAHRNMNGRVLHTAAYGMPVKHKVRHAWKQPVRPACAGCITRRFLRRTGALYDESETKVDSTGRSGIVFVCGLLSEGARIHARRVRGPRSPALLRSA